tara:strand:- start:627 stop:836 length:210 start_codon:yes stop_codon:yes gene_type:complete
MTTLNKDGSPRKSGSGRPKGSKSFINVSLQELQKFVGENALIPVRKVWLHEVAIQLMDRVEEELDSPKQ